MKAKGVAEFVRIPNVTARIGTLLISPAAEIAK